MTTREDHFSYEVYASCLDLSEPDAQLLESARAVSALAYAPYSRFQVGAAARLANGIIVTGTNQENASFPAGLCAERVLLAALSSGYPGSLVNSIAISYRNESGPSNTPVSPCGICRQSLVEFEQRMQQPARLILGGMEGEVYILASCSALLPLAFTKGAFR